MPHLQRNQVIEAKTDAVWAVLGRYMHIDEFSPYITSVEALTEGVDRVGSKRRNHFDNGTSLVEEVTEWKPGQSYTVRLSEMAGNPILEAHAEISVRPAGEGRSTVSWTFDYRVKYGPFGWLLGQTLMKMMMGKIVAANLKGLADRVESIKTAPA